MAQKLVDVLELLRMENIKADSTEGQYRINEVKVEACKEFHRLSSCGECPKRGECDVLQYQIRLTQLRMQPSKAK